MEINQQHQPNIGFFTGLNLNETHVDGGDLVTVEPPAGYLMNRRWDMFRPQGGEILPQSTCGLEDLNWCTCVWNMVT